MTTSTCPHCAAPNPPTAAFCESCGKAMPSAVQAMPRVVTADQAPVTAVGHQLLSDELAKQSKKAFGALLAVGILQLVFGAIAFAAVRASLKPGEEINNSVFVMVIGIGVVFLVLAFWARRNPLPAAIAGLVLFITVHLIDAVTDPTALGRGIVMKIIIIAVLTQAISAGVKHRKLMSQAAAT